MDRRFVKRLPNSAAGPSYKLTLPHQVVHKYMLHLVDADIELASHANAKQIWHGSIAPRRNKERSEFTLQGWRLFAEAHKMQAGDQVAFELVGERRLVAQIIKPADAPPGGQHLTSQVLAYPRQRSVGLKKRRVEDGTLSRTPLKSGRASASWEEEGADLALVPQRRPLEEPLCFADAAAWKDGPDVLSCGGSSGECTRFDFDLPGPSPKADPVPEWVAEEPLLLSGSPFPELQELRQRSSFDSSISPTNRSSSASPGAANVPHDFQGLYRSPGRSPGSPSCMPPSFQDLLNDDPAITDSVVHASPYGSMPKINEPASQLGTQLTDLSFTIQSLQKQAQASRSQANKANQRAASLKAKLEATNGGLDQNSRQALRAVAALEKYTVSFPADCQADIAAFLGQLKSSLSQLLVLSVGDHQGAAEMHPANCTEPFMPPSNYPF